MHQIDYAIAKALADTYGTMCHYTKPQCIVQEDRCRRYTLKSERVDRRMRITLKIESSTPTEIWTAHEFRGVTDMYVDMGDNLCPKCLVICEDQAKYSIDINTKPNEKPLFSHHERHHSSPPACSDCPSDYPEYPGDRPSHGYPSVGPCPDMPPSNCPPTPPMWGPVKPSHGHNHHKPQQRPPQALPDHDHQRPNHGKPNHGQHQKPNHGHHHRPQLGPVDPLPDLDPGFGVDSGLVIEPLPGLDSGFFVDPESNCKCPHDGSIEDHSDCCGLPPYTCPECAGDDTINKTTFRLPSDKA